MNSEDWMDLCPQGGLEPDEAKRIWAVIEAAEAIVRLGWNRKRWYNLSASVRALDGR